MTQNVVACHADTVSFRAVVFGLSSVCISALRAQNLFAFVSAVIQAGWVLEKKIPPSFTFSFRQNDQLAENPGSPWIFGSFAIYTQNSHLARQVYEQVHNMDSQPEPFGTITLATGEEIDWMNMSFGVMRHNGR